MRLAFYTYSYTDRLDMPIEPALEKIADYRAWEKDPSNKEMIYFNKEESLISNS